MALKRNERYPGRFDNPTAAHPQGAFKNRTTPTAKDGSYLERDWANDWDGFMSSLLDAASITPNGSVDEVGASQYYSALLQVIVDNAPTPPEQASIRGSFRNLKASATGTSHPVTITADEVVVKNGSGVAQLLSAVNLSISAAVSGANGLDAGTSAASTWYAIYVIWNGTTAAGLLSLSATSPTLPSGYTHFARVGWMRTDSTGNKYPLKFSQRGRSVEYLPAAGTNLTAHPVLASGTTSSTAVSVGYSNFVPATASTLIFSIYALAPSQTGNYVAFGNISTANFLEYPYFCGGVAGVYATCSGRISAQDSAYWFSGVNINGTIKCLGWDDNL